MTIIEMCQWKGVQESGSWPTTSQENAGSMPPMMRRRLTKLGREVMENLYQNLDYLQSQEIPWVISCQHGDASRMVNLLSNLASRETLSPTDFSLSVHNAIGALFSIATKNKQHQTSLASGTTSFEAGLLEAYALQKEWGGRVGYIYYDAPLPPPYIEENLTTEVYVSLILHGEDPKFPHQAGIRLSFNGEESIKNNPNPVYELIRFFKNNDQQHKLSAQGGTFILERSH